MTDKRIRDIPKIQESLELARKIQKIEQTVSHYESELQQLGINTDQIEASLEEYDVDQLTERIEHLSALPDTFNDLLGSEGWIIYEDMNLDVAETAVEHAKSGDLNAAELELISYYDRSTIEWHLNRLYSVDAFNPRAELAEKALDDYDEGRYHACVPVVLALLDGMVQQAYVDAYGESRGFSTDTADMEAWDSMAGHSTGLEYLQDLMMQGRQKTETDEISKPYRNGIMHGRDLGYDTERVAAKTWAALFAAGEWAEKAENDELEEPEDENDQSASERLMEAVRIHEETQEMKQAANEWEPRDIVVGEDVLGEGELDDYSEDTPERAIVELLSYWKDENYGGMANSLITRDGTTEHPGDIRDEFGHLDLQSFELVQIDETASTRTDVTVRVKFNRFGETVEEETTVTLIRVDDDGDPAIPGHEEGTWTVTNRIKFCSL